MRKDIIQNWAIQNGVNITNEQFEKFLAFQQKVLDANTSRMNLTAITSDEDFAVKHFIDSLTVLKYIPQGAAVLDIGTGAGFPGVVLGIMRPDIRLNLLDSLKKRIHFLEEVLDSLGLDKVECVPTRAEEWARVGVQYDVCTARAVAKMDKLAKYALPLVRPGGVLLAMKGSDVTQELEDAQAALVKYGGVVKSVDVVKISSEIEHSIVVVEKG